MAGCSNQPNVPPHIDSYINTAIDSIRTNALMKDSVDWRSVKMEALKQVEGAKTTVETYPTLRYILDALGDNHSFLQLSDSLRSAEKEALGESTHSEENNSERDPSAFGRRMQPEFSIIDVSNAPVAFTFMPQGRRNSSFASEFQTKLAELSEQGPCGWIIDLRGNGGGNMWPMLAGLGPLLGNGKVGGSIDANSQQDFWIYSDGQAIFADANGEEHVWAEAEDPLVIDKIAEAPKAILIDRGTASSGEAMAVAFRGYSNTRFFGEPTYGASTATRGFPLSDGANLVLAVSTFMDRNGTIYPDGIAPDDTVYFDNAIHSMNNDPILNSALDWIQNKMSCES